MSSLEHLVLIFGAAGQVGTELCHRMTSGGLKVIGLTHADVDITDNAAVMGLVEHHQPAVVINSAAYTAVDQAESEWERAFAVNADGPGVLASAAREVGAVIVHLSTDYVFDGAKASPYVEDDLVRPLNAYGRSKEAGERAVRAANPHHVILRTAWVYGAHGHNFMKTMLRLGAERDVLRVVGDQNGTPTAATDIADAIFSVTDQLLQAEGNFGTFHLTNAGRTTWYGFASCIFEILAARGAKVPRLEPIATAEFPTLAARPAMSVLDCKKIAEAYGIRLRSWERALHEVLPSSLGNYARTAQGAA